MRAPRSCFSNAWTAGGDGTLNDVIAQDHAYFLTVGKVLGQGQRIGNAALAFLIGVVQVSEPELLAIGEQAQKIARVSPAGHQQDIADSGVHQGLDRVKDHGLVVDRKQVFVGDLGQREQTASGSSGEHNTFHVSSLGAAAHPSHPGSYIH